MPFFSFFSFFFLFFFVVLAVVGLARDGCLVRSWCRGSAAGCAAGLRAKRGVANGHKAISQPPRYREVGGVSFSRSK